MLNLSAISRPGADAGAVLAATDPDSLSNEELIEFTQAAERQVAHANAVCLAAVRVLAERAAAAGTELAQELQRRRSDAKATPKAERLERIESEARRSALAERAATVEVAQTLRISQFSAARRVRLAAQLGGRLAPAGAALRDGQLTVGHAWVLADHADDVEDDRLIAAVQAACLPRAAQQSPGNFGRSLTRALHALDPHGQAERQRTARRRAGVYRVQEHEGMATLGITGTDPEVEWGYTVLDTLARGRLHQLKTAATEPGEPLVTADEAACGQNGIVPMPPADVPSRYSEDAAPGTCGQDGIAATPLVQARATTASGAGPLDRCGRNGNVATSLTSAGEDAPSDLGNPEGCGRNDVEETPRLDRAQPDAGSGGTCGRNGNEPTPLAPLPTLDELRSQVFFDLLERAVTDPSFPTQHGKRRIETHIVINLETLIGLREDPGTINGRSVPAPIARELASQTGSLRRLVTDPVLGHLLDYGDRREAPADLTEFLIARDGTCRIPHCNVRAAACDLDHSLSYEEGGRTNAANEGALCHSHHPPKTHGFIDLIESAADGSAVLVTALGQRIPIPPRPVLPEPLEPLGPEVATTDEDGGTTQTSDGEPPF